MSSNAAKAIAFAAIVLTLILALIGYRISRQYAVESQPAPVAAAPAEATQAPKTLAVVADRPIGAYRAITKDDLVLVEVSVAPTDYYTSIDEVVGKQPIVDIDRGAPVTKRYFGEANVLARAIPAGFQAVSVEISDVIAVGGFVRPGDMVDVLIYLRNDQDVDQAQSRILLKKVRVLAYEELLVERPQGLTDEDEKAGAAPKNNGRGRTVRTAVLAVPEAETTRLMLGASQGTLRLALYGQAPAEGETATPEATVAGGLPASSQTLAKIEADKVPDKAVSMEQLSRIKPPPAKQRNAPVQVFVYRGDQATTVSVRP